MPETTVLRSSASPKNASPHMSGGQNHTQLSAAKPMVQVSMTNGGPLPPNQRDRNVMLGRPTQPRRVTPEPQAPQGRQIAAPQPRSMPQIRAQQPSQARPDAPDGRARVEVIGGAPATDPSGAPVKPMVMIRMENGKPSQNTGRQTSGNVVILGRQQGRGGRPAPVQRREVAPEPQPALSSQQLLLARHAISKLTETELDEDTAQLANDTVIAIDAALAYQTQLEIAEATQVPQQVVVSSGGRPPAGVAAPRRFSNRQRPQRVVKAPLQVRMTEGGPVPQTIVSPARGAAPIDTVAEVVESEVVEADASTFDDSPPAA